MSNNTVPYILAYMADSSGCGYHRIVRPLEALIKSCYAIGRAEFQIWDVERLSVLNPNIIVWQRQHEDFQIEHIQRSRDALPKTFFVYEIDDILSACPDWSPHRHHIPYDVDSRMARALMLCDAVTVSTKTLGDHIRSLCGPDFDIRIMPNMVSREDLARADEVRQKSKRIHFKPRIGWGGGISHLGDLQLLLPAIEYFKDKVDWVFLAQKPETDFPVEFHEGVAPNEYLAKLASFDLDLMVAPLVDNKFNRCKSNLRLLEGGACCYPVIASPVEPYVLNSPPVYSYAEPDEWIAKIAEFIKDRDVFTTGQSLRQWVERHYLYEAKLEQRLEAWSPKGTKIFSPKKHVAMMSKVGFVCVEPQIIPEGYEVKPTLEDFVDRNCDIIYVRSGTFLTKDMINDIIKHGATGVSSVCPLTNDGGFPRNGAYVNIDRDKAEGINVICHEMAKDVIVQIPFPYGPVVLLSRKALDLLGFPDTSAFNDVESAITDWGVLASARGFKTLLCCGVYSYSVFPPPSNAIANLSRRLQLRYNLQAPQDPIQDLRVHLELAFFKKFYSHPVPSQNSSYDEWYSIFDTLGRQDKIFLDSYSDKISFDVVYYGEVHRYIEAPWVVFLDKSSVLTDQFVYFFNEAFEQNPDAVFVYADHDFVSDEGKRHKHDFKRHTFDYDLLLGRDYVSQVCAIRSSLLHKLENSPVRANDIYKLAIELGKNIGAKAFVHVPKILAHLVEAPLDKGLAAERSRVAAETSGFSIQPHPEFLQYNVVDYCSQIPNPAPKVSIIIPTKNRVEMLSPCIESLLYFTDYSNYEILVIDNGSTNPTQLEYQELIAGKYKDKLTVLSWPHEYNWSELNNWAVRYAKGDYLLFLNDDTRFADRNWLGQMVGAANRSYIGAVGLKLMYPSGLIQHAGVIHDKGLTGHAHKMLPGNLEGAGGLAILSHSDTAVTGACLLVSIEKFREVGCFDESLAHNFNDIAFCLELNKHGYTNLTVCSAIVQHLEGITRVSPGTPEGQNRMRRESMMLAAKYPTKDPYWNPNLSFIHTMGGLFVTGLNYELLKWPGPSWSWRNGADISERVLLLGDDGTLWVEESREGNLCYLAMLNGYNMQIVRPTLENVPMFDVRDAETAKKFLTELGITKILVRSILGGIVEILPFLTFIGIPIEYRPNSAESVCPRLDCKQDGQDCGSGWRQLDSCSQCLASYGSPFGQVLPEEWRKYWSVFINNAAKVVLNDMPSGLKSAVDEVHYQIGRQYNAE